MRLPITAQLIELAADSFALPLVQLSSQAAEKIGLAVCYQADILDPLSFLLGDETLATNQARVTLLSSWLAHSTPVDLRQVEPSLLTQISGSQLGAWSYNIAECAIQQLRHNEREGFTDQESGPLGLTYPYIYGQIKLEAWILYVRAVRIMAWVERNGLDWLDDNPHCHEANRQFQDIMRYLGLHFDALSDPKARLTNPRSRWRANIATAAKRLNAVPVV